LLFIASILDCNNICRISTGSTGTKRDRRRGLKNKEKNKESIKYFSGTLGHCDIKHKGAKMHIP